MLETSFATGDSHMAGCEAIKNTVVGCRNGIYVGTSNIAGTGASKPVALRLDDNLVLGCANPYAASSGTDVVCLRRRRRYSDDRGDNNVTLSISTDEEIQFFNTSLSTNRTVTLSTAGTMIGDKFIIIRNGLGAGTLNINGLKTIPAATAARVEVEWTGYAWVLTGYTTL